MGGLDFKELFHHRRDARIRVRGQCGVRGRGHGDSGLDRHGRGKLTNFGMLSYCFTVLAPVFHASDRLRATNPSIDASKGRSYNSRSN
jgi:hypothetical protein